jgi:hypothetical protein
MKLHLNLITAILLVILSGSNSFGQNVDPSIQAAFYNKLFPLIETLSTKEVTFVTDEKFKSVAKNLARELENFTYKTNFNSLSEVSEIAIVVGDVSDSDFLVLKNKASLIISLNEKYVKDNLATFCLSKSQGKLQLLASKKMITQSNLKLDNKLWSVMKFIE